MRKTINNIKKRTNYPQILVIHGGGGSWTVSLANTVGRLHLLVRISILLYFFLICCKQGIFLLVRFKNDRSNLHQFLSCLYCALPAGYYGLATLSDASFGYVCPPGLMEVWMFSFTMIVVVMLITICWFYFQLGKEFWSCL